MITVAQFYKGRNVQYASDLTPEIETNAIETLRRANLLLERFFIDRPNASKNRGCNSGWRPPSVNAGTTGAAKKSKHMLGLAIDIGDADGELCRWASDAGQGALVAIGLWMESPTKTPGWLHVQTLAPRSGNRVFLP